MNIQRLLLALTACSLLSCFAFADAPAAKAKEGEFIKSWLILGPIPVPDGAGDVSTREEKAFDQDFFESQGGESEVKPKEDLQITVGKDERSFKQVRISTDEVNLLETLADKERVVAYAATTLHSPEKEKSLLAIGSDDAVKVWLNGKLVHRNWAGRPVQKDEDLIPVTLQKGENRLLLKVQNQSGAWGFCCRLLSGKQLAHRARTAAGLGDLSALKLLLDAGADVNAATDFGLTALHAARIQGQSKAAELLVSRGADASVPMPAPEKLVDSMMSSLIDGDSLSTGASVLVGKDGEIVFSKGYGMACLAHRAPIAPQTKFRIGSVSKQFVAAAILRLAEEKKLSVDDKLSKFLPDYPRADEVTIHQLLTHTSGIHSFTDRPDFYQTVRTEIEAVKMIAWFQDDPFDFEPGMGWKYNNSGYFLLGHIVAKVSDKTLDGYLRETFFEPLGMKNSGVHNSHDVLPNEAYGYSHVNGGFTKALNWDMSRAGGAGALYSTSEDLFRWNEAVFGGKILSEASLKSAFTPVELPEDISSRALPYGYGWIINEQRGLKVIHHSGGLQGFMTHLARYPEHDLTVAVLSNAAPPPPGLIPTELSNRIAEFYLWEDMAAAGSREEVELSEEDLKQFVGRYDYGGAILTVTRDSKSLFAQLTGQPKLPIFPNSPTRFFWKVVEAEVEFVKDDEGKVVKAIHRQGGATINAPRVE